MKMATVLILFMAMLQFIPPQFKGTEYFDNSYYTILYCLLTTLAISLPFLVDSLPKYVKRISMLFGGWYFSALAFEILNWFTPDEVINSTASSAIFVRYSIFGAAALVLIIIKESWTKSTLNT